jgi:hypothetical protein
MAWAPIGRPVSSGLSGITRAEEPQADHYFTPSSGSVAQLVEQRTENARSRSVAKSA